MLIYLSLTTTVLRWAPLLSSSFYRKWYQDTERLSNLSKGTQLNFDSHDWIPSGLALDSTLLTSTYAALRNEMVQGDANSWEEVDIFPYIRFWYNAKNRLLHRYQNNFTLHLNAAPSSKATPKHQEKQETKHMQRKLPLVDMCPLPPPSTQDSIITVLLGRSTQANEQIVWKDTWILGPSRLFTLCFKNFGLYCFHKTGMTELE